MAQKNVYKDSPFLLAIYPHVNKPDDKFNKVNPPYHVTGEGDVADAGVLPLKERIDAAVDAAFEAFFETGQGKSIPKPKRKDWGKYYPYEEVCDDEGNPTGKIRFDFKQNSVIKTADGEKTVEIGLYDANGDEMDPAKDFVRNGATVRVRFAIRAITLKTNEKVGVKLDFSMVQVKEQPARTGGGFGKVDGGYTKGSASGAPDEDQDEQQGMPSTSDSDY